MERDYREFLEWEWWEETLILYLGYINLNMKKRSNDLVKDIIDTAVIDEKGRHRLWLLAAKVLRDFQPAKRDEAVVVLIREKLQLVRYTTYLTFNLQPI